MDFCPTTIAAFSGCVWQHHHCLCLDGTMAVWAGEVVGGRKNWKPLEKKLCWQFPPPPPEKKWENVFFFLLQTKKGCLWFWGAPQGTFGFLMPAIPAPPRFEGRFFFYWGGTFILSLAARSAHTKVIRCHMRIWVRSISDRFWSFLVSWRFLPSKKVLKTSISKNEAPPPQPS